MRSSFIMYHDQLFDRKKRPFCFILKKTISNAEFYTLMADILIFKFMIFLLLSMTATLDMVH